MDYNTIKNKVQNYENCTLEDFKDIFKFVVERKKEELGIEIELELNERMFSMGAFCEYPEKNKAKICLLIGDVREILEDGIEQFHEIRKEFMSHYEEYNLKTEFISSIIALTHELTHIKQMTTDIPTSQNIKMQRELIIGSVFDGFVYENYSQIMMEWDARKNSIKETVDFFKEMECGITTEEIVDWFGKDILDIGEVLDLSKVGTSIEKFGDTYESAMKFFDDINYGMTEINGLDDIVKPITEEQAMTMLGFIPAKRKIFEETCGELWEEYKNETNIERKLELLKEMAITMSPELEEKYPLAKYTNEQAIDENKNAYLKQTYEDMEINNINLESVYQALKEKQKSIEENKNTHDR